MIIIVNVVIVIRYIVITRPCGEEDQTTEHVAISNSASPEIIWGLGGPEEDHQLHHCC